MYRYEKRKGGNEGITLAKVVKHENFELPSDFDVSDVRMWRRLRLKSRDYNDHVPKTDDVVGMLVQRGLLTPEMEGNYRVEGHYHKQGVSAVRQLGFFKGDIAYFFKEEGTVKGYSRSIQSPYIKTEVMHNPKKPKEADSD